MSKLIVWSASAVADLDDITFYIAVQDRRPDVGERIYRELPEFVAKCFEEHVPGHRHVHAPSDWFYWRYKRWLVFYRASADGIEVMRLVDPVQDLPQVIGQQ